MKDYEEIEYGEVVFKLLDTRHGTLDQVRQLHPYELAKAFTFLIHLYGYTDIDAESVPEQEQRRVVLGELQIDYDSEIYGTGAEIMTKPIENQAKRVKEAVNKADAATPSETKEKTKRTKTLEVVTARGKKGTIEVEPVKNPGPHPTSKAGKSSKSAIPVDTNPTVSEVVSNTSTKPRKGVREEKVEAAPKKSARPNPSKHVEAPKTSTVATKSTRPSEPAKSNAKSAVSSKPTTKPSSKKVEASPGAATEPASTGPKKSVKVGGSTNVSKKVSSGRADTASSSRPKAIVPSVVGDDVDRDKLGRAKRKRHHKLDVNAPARRVSTASGADKPVAIQFRNTAFGRKPSGEFIRAFLIKHKGKRIEELEELLRTKYAGTGAGNNPRKHIYDYRSVLYREGLLTKPANSRGRKVWKNKN